MQKLQSIQVLRAVAVLPVVAFHFTNFPIGRAGVDLFFCISGYVMAGQMTRTPTQFAWDRLTRIYPPFLAAMVLLFLLNPGPPDFARLLRSLVLFPDYHRIYLYPAWSLGYEAMFYAACVAAMFIGGVSTILSFFALFLLRVPYAGSAFVLEFLAGFAIARRQWWALPLLLAAATTDTRVFCYGTSTAFLLWAATSREHWFHADWWGPAAIIGDASYSIYLTHSTIGVAVADLPLLTAIYVCVVCGLAFHFVVEKPLVRLARRCLKAKPAAPLEARGVMDDIRVS